jgi:hypothetical protein
MSKQLTLSATISVAAAVLFALSATLGLGQGEASRSLAGTAPLATFSVDR